MKIKRIGLDHLNEAFHIAANAFPAYYKQILVMEEMFKRAEKVTDGSMEYRGIFKDEKLIAIYRQHRFFMNFYGNIIPVGGIGAVAVDLLHKKEKVCKFMLQSFLKEAKFLNQNIAALYSFRPDFYHKMGFGFGSPKFSYEIAVASLPKREKSPFLEFASDTFADELLAYMNKRANSNHGLFLREEREVKPLKSMQPRRIIFFRQNGKIKGYCIFTFNSRPTKNNFVNTLKVLELDYDNTEVLEAFLTFFRTQSDQVERVIIDTFDPYFYFHLRDMRNTTDNFIRPLYHEMATAGMGIMYKGLNLQNLIQLLPSYSEKYSLKFEIEDSFSGNHDFSIGYGDVLVKTDIQTFSAVIIGSLPISIAIRKNLIETNDFGKNQLGKLFANLVSPKCYTSF